MKDEISLSDALKIINRVSKDGEAHPFDITVRTLNRNSKTGGTLKTYPAAKLLRNETKQNLKPTILNNVLVAETFKRDPNHWTNRTRNIMLTDGKIRKIHLRLMVSINNQKIVY